MRRWGYTEISRQLVERAGGADVLDIAIDDALRAATMTKDDHYYIRVAVIELPADCEVWPFEGASEDECPSN